MRQSIVEMMMRARDDLKELLSSSKIPATSSSIEHPHGSEKIYTEKDCQGIGKNVLLHGDALKGYHAYDEAIKSFVVEKVGFFNSLFHICRVSLNIFVLADDMINL